MSVRSSGRKSLADEQQELQHDNFDLKMRCFYLEERLRRTESLLAGGGGSDSGLPARTTPHPPPHPQSLPLRKVSS